MSISSVNFNTELNNMQLQNEHVVIVYTQWNKKFIDKLLEGAKEILDQYQNTVKYSLVEVPGSIEIPFAVKAHYAKNHNNATKRATAYIAFGIVIKGETAHFKYVCNSVTTGITALNTTLPVPTIYGVLTVHNEVQIIERLGGTHGHKGQEAAITALRMIHLNNTI